MALEVDAPFILGNKMTALAAAAAGVLLDGPQTGSLIQVNIMNGAASATAFAYASTAATAQANAAVPTAGNSTQANVTVLLAGQQATFTVAPGQYWSASQAGGYIQAGTGT